MQEIDRFLKNVQGNRDKDSTIETRTTALRCFEEWCSDNGIDDVTNVTVIEIDDYLYYLGREGFKGSTVKGRWWSLNKFYNDLVAREAIEENPLEKVDKHKHLDLFNSTIKEDYVDEIGGIFALEEDEIQELSDNVQTNGNKTRNELIILLSYHTGVRRQELADIKLEKIDRQERRIEVYSSKSDSNYVNRDARRPVWYGPTLDPLMDKWIEIEREGYVTSDSPYLFVTERSERIAEHTINEVVKQAAENTGLQETMAEDASGQERHLITHHTLRHSFARECMVPDETGSRIDVKRLANLMGNDPETVAESYLHFAEDDDRDARQLYGPR